MIKVSIKQVPIKNSDLSARYENKQWIIKTDGPKDFDKPNGSYLVFCHDGRVLRRTLDADGFIIHEIEVRKEDI